jgi:hypothetical protein
MTGPMSLQETQLHSSMRWVRGFFRLWVALASLYILVTIWFLGADLQPTWKGTVNYPPLWKAPFYHVREVGGVWSAAVQGKNSARRTTFSITAPDGTYTVAGPPGLTEDDAIAYAQSMVEGEALAIKRSRQALAMVFGPPFGLLAVGIVFWWVLRGFARR